MFQNILRSWGRLVGGQPEAAVDEDRRVWVRFPCDLEVTCQPTKAPQRLSARVQDISVGGISLAAGYPFETGGLLSVELPAATDGSSTTVLAYVVRVTQKAAGEWVVGCNFATELGDDDLESLGARRLKPPGADQRAWVRFPSDARATFQRVRDPEARPRPAAVANISPTGAGLIAREAVDAGDLLSVELQDPQGKCRLTMMASVTRVTSNGAGEWSVGCSFIRELSETEIATLV